MLRVRCHCKSHPRTWDRRPTVPNRLKSPGLWGVNTSTSLATRDGLLEWFQAARSGATTSTSLRTWNCRLAWRQASPQSRAKARSVGAADNHHACKNMRPSALVALGPPVMCRSSSGHECSKRDGHRAYAKHLGVGASAIKFSDAFTSTSTSTRGNVAPACKVRRLLLY